MNNNFFNAINVHQPIFSKRLSRNLSCISYASFVEVGAQSNGVVLTSVDKPEGQTHHATMPAGLMSAPGDLLRCEAVTRNVSQEMRKAAALGISLDLRDQTKTGADEVGKGASAWHGFRMTFAAGTQDLISILARQTCSTEQARAFLTAVWPVLREDCLEELTGFEGQVCDKALLWLIASEINVSILVMNKDGLVLRANAAAKRQLDQETVLRRTPHGMRCVNDLQTRLFHRALAVCAAADPVVGDQILFLDASRAQADGLSLRIPVTLTRFCHQGAATDLVLVTMSLPPDSRRIEMLARAGGLTPSEARVAALLQLGLSNKDVAIAAGLKEQSVSTYAKRALSKLHVTSRAEMAQMLTWQAAGGRLS